MLYKTICFSFAVGVRAGVIILCARVRPYAGSFGAVTRYCVSGFGAKVTPYAGGFA